MSDTETERSFSKPRKESDVSGFVLGQREVMKGTLFEGMAINAGAQWTCRLVSTESRVKKREGDWEKEIWEKILALKGSFMGFALHITLKNIYNKIQVK